MNHRLSEQCIRSTCRELIARHAGVSGRRLREELRQRFGAVGKTERVFAIWREEVAALTVGADHAELKARLAAAQAEAAENLARAQAAEFRERVLKDKCTMEVNQLRIELQAAKGS